MPKSQQEVRRQRRIYSTKLIDQLIRDRQNGYEIDFDPFFQRDLELRAEGIPFNMTEWELEEYQKCYDDPIYYTEKYAKFMTDYGLSTVDLREYQKKIISAVTAETYDASTDLLIPDNQDVIIMASRQTGKCGLFSDYVEVIDNDLSGCKKKSFLNLINKYTNKKGILYKIKTFLCKIYCKL